MSKRNYPLLPGSVEGPKSWEQESRETLEELEKETRSGFIETINAYLGQRKSGEAQRIRGEITRLESALRALGEVWEDEPSPTPALREIKRVRMNSGNQKIREALARGPLSLSEAQALGGFSARGSVYSALFQVGAKLGEDRLYRLGGQG